MKVTGTRGPPRRGLSPHGSATPRVGRASGSRVHARCAGVGRVARSWATWIKFAFHFIEDRNSFIFYILSWTLEININSYEYLKIVK